MFISELRLGNFQSFRAANKIPLAPLTLILGPNSSGKSAIIKSLLLLKQTDRDQQNGSLTFVGPDVDLGGFDNTINGHSADLEMSIGLSFREPGGPDWSVDYKIDRSERIVELRQKGFANTGAKVLYKKGVELTFTYSPDDLEYFVQATNKAAWRSLYLAFTEWSRARRTISSESLEEFTSSIRNAGFDLSGIGVRPLINYALPTSGASGRADENTRQLRYGVSAQIGAPSARVRRLLHDAVHIAGLRSIPDRFDVVRESRIALKADSSNIYQFLTSYPGALKVASSNLKRLTKGAYELQHVDLKLAAQTTDLPVKIGTLALVDKRAGITTHFKDVGTGLSQVLPILATLSLANATYSAFGSQLLLVEQPELHLHPKMQGDLAEMIALQSGAGKKNGPQVILETHSENFLLRVQRLVREGKLPNDKIEILYVDRALRTGTARVKRLSLDTNGDLIGTLPVDFSDIRLSEFF